MKRGTTTKMKRMFEQRVCSWRRRRKLQRRSWRKQSL